MRKVVAVISGLIATFVVMMTFEFTNSFLYPFPNGFDTGDASQLRNFIELNSPNIFFLVVAGWICGAFAGGTVVAKVSRSRSAVPSLVAGIIWTVLQILNFQFLPHPTWAMAIGVTLMIPLYFLGNQISKPPEVPVSGSNG